MSVALTSLQKRFLRRNKTQGVRCDLFPSTAPVQFIPTAGNEVGKEPPSHLDADDKQWFSIPVPLETPNLTHPRSAGNEHYTLPVPSNAVASLAASSSPFYDTIAGDTPSGTPASKKLNPVCAVRRCHSDRVCGRRPNSQSDNKQLWTGFGSSGMRNKNGSKEKPNSATVPTNDFEWEASCSVPPPPSITQMLDQDKQSAMLKPIARKPSKPGAGSKLLASLPNLVSNLRNRSNKKSHQPPHQMHTAHRVNDILIDQSHYSFSASDISRMPLGATASNTSLQQSYPETAGTGQGFRRSGDCTGITAGNHAATKRYSWAGGDREPDFLRYESDKFRSQYAHAHSPIKEDDSEIGDDITPSPSGYNLQYNYSNSSSNQTRRAIPQSASHNQLITNAFSDNNNNRSSNGSRATDDIPPKRPLPPRQPLGQRPVSYAPAASNCGFSSYQDISVRVRNGDSTSTVGSHAPTPSGGHNGNLLGGGASTNASSITTGTSAYSSAYHSHGGSDSLDLPWDKEKALLIKLYEDKIGAVEKRLKEQEDYYSSLWKKENPQMLREDLRRTTSELGAAQNTVRNLSNVLSDKDSEILGLKDQFSALSHDFQQQTHMIGHLHQKVAESQNYCNYHKNQAVQLQSELNGSRSELQRLQTDNTFLQSKITSLESSSSRSRGHEKPHSKAMAGQRNGIDSSKSNNDTGSGGHGKDVNGNIVDKSSTHEQGNSTTAFNGVDLGGSKSVDALSDEVKQLHGALQVLQQDRSYQASLYERERVCWLEEKEIVLQYQKQLQANYAHVHNINKNLQKQMNKFTQF